MGDFNMPPGVSVRDIPGWDCDDEPHIFHCSHCGAFIKNQPSRHVTRVIQEWCDGKVHEWKHEYEESTIMILGDEYRGKTYSSYHVMCKDEEVGPQTEPHLPHFYDESGDEEWQVLCRKCCRYTTIDADGYPLH